MKIPGLAMVIPGIMISSIIELSNTDIAADQARPEGHSTVAQKITAIPHDPEIVPGLLYQERYMDAMDLQGRTTLMWAAEHGETALVQKLLEAGAAVNAADWWGRTALGFALENNHRKIISLLIEHGANISAG